MTQVVIIIVNWNTGALLARCVRAIARLPERGAVSRVLVVDNASRDRSLVQAQVAVGQAGNQPPVNFIKLEKNVGFARGNNLALERVRAMDHQGPVLLLNPDTEVQPGAVSALLAALARHDRVGIVGPLLLNEDRSVQPSVRAFPTLGVLLFMFLKLHRLVPHAALWQQYMRSEFDYTRESAVDQVMGAALLIRGETLREIGPLYPRFYLWFEEVDWCQRARAAGWEVWFTPEAKVIHHGAVSFSQLVGPARAWPWIMSSLHYARKHLGWGAVMVLAILAPVALLLSVPAALWHVKARAGRNRG